jgi:CheY-like chemotaxis protein
MGGIELADIYRDVDGEKPEWRLGVEQIGDVHVYYVTGEVDRLTRGKVNVNSAPRKMFRRPEMILIAEDNPDDVLLLRHALKRTGISSPIHVCRDGQEAKEYLQGVGEYVNREKYPFPQLLITDIKMPRCSGLELVEWISEHPTCSVMPVIILSASALPEDVARAYSLGVSTFFQKPSSLDDLVELLKTVQLYWKKAVFPQLPKNCA